MTDTSPFNAYVRPRNGKRRFIGVFNSLNEAMTAANIVAPPTMPPTQPVTFDNKLMAPVTPQKERHQ